MSHPVAIHRVDSQVEVQEVSSMSTYISRDSYGDLNGQRLVKNSTA